MSEMSPVNLYSREMQIEDAIVAWFKRADGRLKTFIEAITEDAEQCRSRKDVVSELLWLEVDKMVEEVTDIVKQSDPKMYVGTEKGAASV